jgi:hypothetical protein
LKLSNVDPSDLQNFSRDQDHDGSMFWDNFCNETEKSYFVSGMKQILSSVHLHHGSECMDLPAFTFGSSMTAGPLIPAAAPL